LYSSRNLVATFAQVFTPLLYGVIVALATNRGKTYSTGEIQFK